MATLGNLQSSTVYKKWAHFKVLLDAPVPPKSIWYLVIRFLHLQVTRRRHIFWQAADAVAATADSCWCTWPHTQTPALPTALDALDAVRATPHNCPSRKFKQLRQLRRLFFYQNVWYSVIAVLRTSLTRRRRIPGCCNITLTYQRLCIVVYFFAALHAFWSLLYDFAQRMTRNAHGLGGSPYKP